MKLTTGMRLRSQVCETEVIVTRPGELSADLLCGGAAMVPSGTEVTAGPIAEGLSGGTLLGKRYTLPGDDLLELLATKAGAGSLSVGDELLVVKAAKALPSSD